MQLTRLTIKGFRNLSELTLEPHSHFNFIFGANGQGKTNLIESIFYLSQLKSFRGADKESLIGMGLESAQLKAVFEKDDLDWEISLTLATGGRQVELNRKRPPSKKAYLSLIPVVLFEPRHIYLFRDSPSERRSDLNRALFLMEPDILTTITDYGKIVSQKNALLKETPHSELLEAYNHRLAQLGAKIISARLRYFRAAQALLAAEYHSASGSADHFSLRYQPNGLADLPLTEQVSEAEIAERLLMEMSAQRTREIQRRETLIGPHRDDYTAYLDDRLLGQLGSQGENRSASIALKLTQLKLFAQKHGKTPLFLLDDVASELDEKRREHLFKYLKDEPTQVFLTTPDFHLKNADFAGKSRAFLVEQGRATVLDL